MKTILVTGGAGFVGSHACKALAQAGYLPVTFDNLERGHERAVKWGPLERGDLRHRGDLERAFATHRPWAVMHFAAYAYVGESTAEPLKYYENNVGGSANLLAACAAFDCRNLVFSSSCATYGIPERLPITEATAQNPVNPYGYTKLVMERLLRDAEAACGIRHVALRYFNAAGADRRVWGTAVWAQIRARRRIDPGPSPNTSPPLFMNPKTFQSHMTSKTAFRSRIPPNR